MIQDFEDFCLWTYVVVDDIRREIGKVLRRPGPEPRCSDSELMTMTLVGECRGWALETELLSCWREHGDLFPHIPTQSRYNLGHVTIRTGLSENERLAIGGGDVMVMM